MREQFISNDLTKQCMRKWTIYQFCFSGILVASGPLNYPRRRMYWSSKAIMKNEAVCSSISQKRFELIFSKLHFVDNSAIQNDPNKFAKVQPLLDRLNKAFIKHGPACSHFSVDECIVPYYGRHGAKQFIRGKPIRFGYKVYSYTFLWACFLWQSDAHFVCNIINTCISTFKQMQDILYSSLITFIFLQRVRELLWMLFFLNFPYSFGVQQAWWDISINFNRIPE